MDAGLEALMVFVGAVGGGAIGSFWKKKAENLATKQDVEKLTDLAKRVEAKISNEVWDRQKRWELRREVLFEAAKRIAAVFDQLGQLEIVLQTKLNNRNMSQDVFDLTKVKVNEKWFGATAALRESRLFIEVTCGKDIANATDKFVHLASTVAEKIHKNDGDIYRKSVDELFALNDAIRAAIRKELSIDGDVEGER